MPFPLSSRNPDIHFWRARLASALPGLPPGGGEQVQPGPPSAVPSCPALSWGGSLRGDQPQVTDPSATPWAAGVTGHCEREGLKIPGPRAKGACAAPGPPGPRWLRPREGGGWGGGGAAGAGEFCSVSKSKDISAWGASELSPAALLGGAAGVERRQGLVGGAGGGRGGHSFVSLLVHSSIHSFGSI